MERARQYVRAGQPFWFLSQRKDAALLGKKEGGAGGCFDFRGRKMWFADSPSMFAAMWRTGKVALEEGDVDGNLVLRVFEELEEQEAQEKQAASASAAKARAERAAAAEASNAKSLLVVPLDEPEKMAVLAELGITPVMVAASANFSSFGPRGGISNAARVLRGLKFRKATVDDIVGGLVLQKEEEAVAQREAKRSNLHRGPQTRRTSTLLHVPETHREFAPKVEPLSFGSGYQYVPHAPPVVVCRSCGYQVYAQFGECRCMWPAGEAQ